MNQQIKQLVTRIAQNITIDFLRGDTAEQAAKSQHSQMRQTGIPVDVCNGIISMALEIAAA